MRVYLLPISTRRTLLYGQRLGVSQSEKQTWSEWIQNRAAKMWAEWEKKEKGWQKSVVGYGNHALRRIPYEEWGLRSIPPLSERTRRQELDGSSKAEVVFPPSLIRADRVAGMLERLGTERDALHRRKLVWCFVWMPVTAPIGLIPLVPNLPFFYLVYRAWSHWRALSGGRHVQFLVQNKLLAPQPSPILDSVYAVGRRNTLPSTSNPTTGARIDADKSPQEESDNGRETLLISQDACKAMTQALDLPQLEVELERAIWQVEGAIKKQNDEAKVDGQSDTNSKATPKPDRDAGRDVDKKTR